MTETPVSAVGSADQDRRTTLWRIGTALAIAVILLVRCASAYSHPILWGDDWNLFVRFIATPGAHAIFQPYAGYVSVVPSAVGWFASNFPFGTRPFLLAWAPYGIGIAALSLFSAARFSHLLPDVRQRSLVCVLLAMAPVSNAALVSATMFSSWHLLFVLALVAVAQPPTTRRLAAGEVAILGLCICSHPLSFVLVPLFGWRASAAPTRMARAYFGALAGIACLYFVCQVESEAVRVRDWARTAVAALEMLTHGVVGATLLHGSSRTEIPVSLAGFAVLSAPVMAVLFAVFRGGTDQSRKRRQGLMSLMMTAFVLVIMTTLGRLDESGKLILSPRYTYVPSLCWYLVVLVTVLSAARDCTPRLRALLTVGLIVHTAALNVNRGYLYRTSADTGDRVVRFAASIDDWLDAPDGADTLTLPIPGRRLRITRPIRMDTR